MRGKGTGVPKAIAVGVMVGEGITIADGICVGMGVELRVGVCKVGGVSGTVGTLDVTRPQLEIIRHIHKKLTIILRWLAVNCCSTFPGETSNHTNNEPDIRFR